MILITKILIKEISKLIPVLFYFRNYWNYIVQNIGNLQNACVKRIHTRWVPSSADLHFKNLLYLTSTNCIEWACLHILSYDYTCLRSFNCCYVIILSNLVFFGIFIVYAWLELFKKQKYTPCLYLLIFDLSCLKPTSLLLILFYDKYLFHIFVYIAQFEQLHYIKCNV